MLSVRLKNSWKTAPGRALLRLPDVRTGAVPLRTGIAEGNRGNYLAGMPASVRINERKSRIYRISIPALSRDQERNVRMRMELGTVRAGKERGVFGLTCEMSLLSFEKGAIVCRMVARLSSLTSHSYPLN
jgi:hypothetical protein